jgi:phenylalanyl-tRNA synthetase beta chain
MRLSWRLLSEMVDLRRVDPAEAARLLTFRTAEVEHVEHLGGSLSGVVTAKVRAVDPHPGADRLRLCTVDVGGGAQLLRVVCGAPNVAAGQTVCFAPVGTTLPNGVTLKKAKIRGVESEGMICAEDEMGLGTAHDGIVVLDPETPVGVPVSEALGLSDVVFDVANSAITSRPDLWGHVGFARELAAILDRRFTAPPTDAAQRAVGAAGADPFPVRVEDEAGCRRYVALVVEGVANGPSPAGVVRRLEALGLRAVSLLVDLTNLVMAEQGQPLHAFDLREVRGGAVRVRRAAAGERFTALDEKERTLVADDLVIADEERVLALAGVMGGAASAVGADTTTVLLESATFDPGRVRRSAIRHGLRTDASARFEKSLDPAGAPAAAMRWLELLLAHVPGARVAARTTDVYPRPLLPLAIELPFDLVRRRLGLPLADAEIVTRLASVGFRGSEVPGGVRVRVPSWRATKDVSIPEDLVEEVGRLHGYEHVVPEPHVAPMVAVRPSPERSLERATRAVLGLDLAHAEVAHYAFHGEAEAQKLGLDPATLLRLSNPLSSEQDRMQATCVQNLLRIAARNQPTEPRTAPLRLAEWTRVFSASAPADRAEVPVVGCLTARADLESDPRGDVFRGVVEDVRVLLERVGVRGVRVADGGEAPRHDAQFPPATWLHPGRSAVFTHAGDGGPQVLAVVGEVHPRVRRAFGVAGVAAAAEVRLDRVLAARASESDYRAPPRFPESTFDVAVVVPRKTPAAEVEAVLARCAGGAVRSVRWFDLYEGKGIPAGQKSLAFTVAFGDEGGTLTGKTLEKLQGRAIDALTRAGWKVRMESGAAGEPPA